MEPWIYWKYVEEPDYGPGPQCQTIIFMSELRLEEELPPGIGNIVLVIKILIIYCSVQFLLIPHVDS